MSGVFAEIEDLTKLCSSGKLYEVETWISEGRPIQCARPDDRKLRRRQTPLQIAVKKGFHSLAALLLANGYDPNGDYFGCLSPAVRARDHEMVELLLRFGAYTASVEFQEVLETYDRPLIDRFIAVGFDPCANNAVARALQDKARPLLGFIKTYKERFPGLQRQIDIALHQFVHDQDEKGVCLMLWLGADPYARVPSDPYSKKDEDDQGNALETALWLGSEKVLKHIRIDPTKVSLDELLDQAVVGHNPEIICRLIAMGANPNAQDTRRGSVMLTALHSVLWSGEARFEWSLSHKEGSIGVLSALLENGGRFVPKGHEGLGSIRRGLLRCEASFARRIVGLLEKFNGITTDQMAEMLRTPAIKDHLQLAYARGRYPPFATSGGAGSGGYFRRRRWR